MLSLGIVLSPLVAKSWIPWTHCTSSWKGRLSSHRSDNLERFPKRSWYSTWPYSAKRCAIMSCTWMCVKPQFRSNTPARNFLVTNSMIFFLLHAPGSPTLYVPCTPLSDPGWDWPNWCLWILSGLRVVQGQEVLQMQCQVLWFRTPCRTKVLQGIRTCLLLSWMESTHSFLSSRPS